MPLHPAFPAVILCGHSRKDTLLVDRVGIRVLGAEGLQMFAYRTTKGALQSGWDCIK